MIFCLYVCLFIREVLAINLINLLKAKEGDIEMKKFFVSLMLAFTILFVDADLGFAREFDFEWQFACGDVFEAVNDSGTRYEISAPSSNAITVLSQNGGNLEVRFETVGDFYIVAHVPNGQKYFYHLMVGGQENHPIIEQRIEDGNENFAQEILTLVNRERNRLGIAPLHLSQDLMVSATIRSKEIERRYSHTRPDGSDCFTVLKSIKHTAGENIAAGQETAQDVMNAWMNSQGHRANILNPAFHELGVGYHFKYGSKHGYYWVQIFRG